MTRAAAATTVTRRTDPEFTALVAALESLRIQGGQAPQPHYEPSLRHVLGVPAGMPALKARPYVNKAVLSCASRLEAHEGRAFLTAAGFFPAAPRSSGTRMKSAAQVLGVSERTAYRRVASATAAIASLLLTASDAPALQERDWAMMRVSRRVDLSDDEPSMVFVQTVRALRDRLQSKKISKTQAVTSNIHQHIDPHNIHVGPSDYVPWLDDRKFAFVRLEGRNFGDVPVSIEYKLEVWDSPNSAGVVIDAIRAAKIGLDRKIGGPLLSPSSYFMKSPLEQRPDDEALESVQAFIAGEVER